jgi:hypothetical protein
MRRSQRRCVFAATLFFAAVAFVSMSGAPAGQDTKPAPDTKKAPGGDTAKPLPIDKMKLPPGAIFVLCEELKDSLALFPKFVMIRPDKLSELNERIKQLERQLRSEKKLPHALKMTAVIEGDSARLQAEFVFETDEPRTRVFLGCKGAHITDANLKSGDAEANGGIPFLDLGPDGYEVLVPNAGRSHLTLHMKLGVTVGGTVAPIGGGERSFELGLPGAAVTTLALDLPYPIRELRWNKNVEKTSAGDAQRKQWELVLGKITNLVTTWREPVKSPEAGPLLTAKGQVVVKVDESRVVTTADLTLLDPRGQAKEWRLWLAAKAKLKVLTPAGLRHKVTMSANNIHVLKLEEATTEPIKVQVSHEQPRSQPRVPIGPFALAEAYRQEGTIDVRASLAARRGFRLAFHVNDEVEERELPKEASSESIAYFKYRGLPTPGKPNPPTGSKSPGSGAALELELKAAKGRVETKVEHHVRVRPVESHLQVTMSSKIQVEPLYAPVDFLDVQLPPPRWEGFLTFAGARGQGFPDQFPWGALSLQSMLPPESDWVVSGEVPAELVFPDVQSRVMRKARIKLASYQHKEFSVVLSSTYQLPATSQRLRAELPRPLAILDRGAKLKVEVDDSRELLLRDGGVELPVPERGQHTTHWDRSPSTADIAWRPYRPEFPVLAVADVSIRDRSARVQQQMTFALPERTTSDAKTRQFSLRVPKAIRSFKVGGGFKLINHAREQQTATVVLLADASANPPLIVEYDVVLPPAVANGPTQPEDSPAAVGASREFQLPLTWLGEATRVRTKLRLWGDAGLLPQVIEGPLDEPMWRNLGTEIVSGRDSLPLRVYQSEDFEAPLRIRLEEGPPLVAGVIVDKVLLQIHVQEDGSEHYRARFRLSKLQVDHLDIRFPAAISGLFLDVVLDDKKVPWRLVGGDGRVVRLSLEPSLYRQSALLEIVYQLPRSQPESEALWQTMLHPPELLGNVSLGTIRWQIQMPSKWVPVLLDSDATAEQRWGWRGWLPAPEAATSAADLETWLTDKASDSKGLPSLVCERASLEPLRVLRVPQSIWLLIGSGVLLVIGLGLNFAPLPAPLYWSAVLLLGAAMVAGGVVWPAILPAVLYACLPGLAVLFVVVGVQWLVRQRYRRQLLFLPGFARAPSGSSLSRGSGVSRTRDPSTVDAPAAAAVNSGSRH